MTCTLSRNGLSFSRSNDREYGAWGEIRSGSGGDQGYVGNLGHRKDAESGLTYMRARYYEPGTGRFVSQDRAMDGQNWFVYCGNSPVNRVDFTGKMWQTLLTGSIQAFFMFIEDIVGWNIPWPAEVSNSNNGWAEKFSAHVLELYLYCWDIRFEE